MPSFLREDDKPVVQFDPRIEVSPFTLFRRLRAGRAPLLVDVRREPAGYTLHGATRWPGEEWRPAADEEAVLFDDDGAEAVPIVERLQREGCAGVKLLFGGLELYEFSLDPQVVGEETFLEKL